MWALIMTVFIYTPGGRPDVEVTTLDGFTSAKNCDDARLGWLKPALQNAVAVDLLTGSVRLNAVCVRK